MIAFTILATAHTSIGLAATAEPSPAARQFYAQCVSAGVDLAVTYPQVAARPGAYSGKALILGGTVAVTVRTIADTTLVLSLPEGVQCAMTGRLVSPYHTGDSVYALVRVPANWTGTTDLGLVAVTGRPQGAWALSQLTVKSRVATVRAGRPVPHSVYSRRGRSGVNSTSRGFVRDMASRRTLLEQYTSAIHYFNHKLPEAKARTIAGHIIWYSETYGVDARLIVAVIAVESEFDTKCTSNHGAMGLGQLMPGTARDLGVTNAYDPEQNIAASVRLIRWHLAQNMNASDPLALALACYNAGPNAVLKYHGIPPYAETIHYVQKVETLYSEMCRNDPH
jgi:soluble lytic murein transglycosylase-like protein